MFIVEEPKRVEVKVGETVYHLTPLGEMEAEKALLIGEIQSRALAAKGDEISPTDFLHLLVEMLEIATDIPKPVLMKLKINDLKALALLARGDDSGNAEPGAAPK